MSELLLKKKKKKTGKGRKKKQCAQLTPCQSMSQEQKTKICKLFIFDNPESAKSTSSLRKSPHCIACGSGELQQVCEHGKKKTAVKISRISLAGAESPVLKISDRKFEFLEEEPSRAEIKALQQLNADLSKLANVGKFDIVGVTDAENAEDDLLNYDNNLFDLLFEPVVASTSDLKKIVKSIASNLLVDQVMAVVAPTIKGKDDAKASSSDTTGTSGASSSSSSQSVDSESAAASSAGSAHDAPLPDLSHDLTWQMTMGFTSPLVRDIPGVRGKGVQVLDVEYSIGENHDLPHITDIMASKQRWKTEILTDPFYLEHGTACFGMLIAKNNSIGTTGAVHECTPFSGNQWGAWQKLQGHKWVDPAYLTTHVDVIIGWAVNPSNEHRFGPGDTIFIEHQEDYVCGEADDGYGTKFQGPAETVPAVRAAIKEALDQGVYVVEPMGNGAMDLDEGGCEGLYAPAKMSGAIMVAASDPSWDPRDLADFSTYGSAADVYAWGLGNLAPGIVHAKLTQDVPGLGSANDIVVQVADDQGLWGLPTDATPEQNADYQSFVEMTGKVETVKNSPNGLKFMGGTSGAVPAVASVVVALSGVLKEAGVQPVPPSEMRKWIKSAAGPLPVIPYHDIPGVHLVAALRKTTKSISQCTFCHRLANAVEQVLAGESSSPGSSEESSGSAMVEIESSVLGGGVSMLVQPPCKAEKICQMWAKEKKGKKLKKAGRQALCEKVVDAVRSTWGSRKALLTHIDGKSDRSPQEVKMQLNTMLNTGILGLEAFGNVLQKRSKKSLFRRSSDKAMKKRYMLFVKIMTGKDMKKTIGMVYKPCTTVVGPKDGAKYADNTLSQKHWLAANGEGVEEIETVEVELAPEDGDDSSPSDVTSGGDNSGSGSDDSNSSLPASSPTASSESGSASSESGSASSESGSASSESGSASSKSASINRSTLLTDLICGKTTSSLIRTSCTSFARAAADKLENIEVEKATLGDIVDYVKKAAADLQAMFDEEDNVTVEPKDFLEALCSSRGMRGLATCDLSRGFRNEEPPYQSLQVHDQLHSLPRQCPSSDLEEMCVKMTDEDKDCAEASEGLSEGCIAACPIVWEKNDLLKYVKKDTSLSCARARALTLGLA